MCQSKNLLAKLFSRCSLRKILNFLIEFDVDEMHPDGHNQRTKLTYRVGNSGKWIEMFHNNYLNATHI